MTFFKTSDGCNLYYETIAQQPANPWVVFLNGTAQTTLYWRPLAPHLSAEFNLLFYDARAQGRSDLGAIPLTLEGHVDDLTALLQQLNLTRVNLVGLSHGARVALRLALDRPKLVRRLVLGSIGVENHGQVKTWLYCWQQILRTGGPEALAWSMLPMVVGTRYLQRRKRLLSGMVAAIAARNKTEALHRHLQAMQQYAPLEAWVRPIDVPCQVICGTEDQIATPPQARRLADLLTAEYIQIEQAGHSFPAEKPEVFKRATVTFLSSAKP